VALDWDPRAAARLDHPCHQLPQPTDDREIGTGDAQRIKDRLHSPPANSIRRKPTNRLGKTGKPPALVFAINSGISPSAAQPRDLISIGPLDLALPCLSWKSLEPLATNQAPEKHGHPLDAPRTASGRPPFGSGRRSTQSRHQNRSAGTLGISRNGASHSSTQGGLPYANRIPTEITAERPAIQQTITRTRLPQSQEISATPHHPQHRCRFARLGQRVPILQRSGRIVGRAAQGSTLTSLGPCSNRTRLQNPRHSQPFRWPQCPLIECEGLMLSQISEWKLAKTPGKQNLATADATSNNRRSIASQPPLSAGAYKPNRNGTTTSREGPSESAGNRQAALGVAESSRRLLPD